MIKTIKTQTIIIRKKALNKPGSSLLPAKPALSSPPAEGMGMQGDRRGRKLTWGTAGLRARDMQPFAGASPSRGPGGSSAGTAPAPPPPLLLLLAQQALLPSPSFPRPAAAAGNAPQGRPHALLDGAPRERRQETGRAPSCQLGGSDGPDLHHPRLWIPSGRTGGRFLSFVASPPRHSVHPVQTKKAFLSVLPFPWLWEDVWESYT